MFVRKIEKKQPHFLMKIFANSFTYCISVMVPGRHMQKTVVPRAWINALCVSYNRKKLWDSPPESISQSIRERRRGGDS
jgi:hypothetical protein